METTKVRWGILGAGSIAKAFARGVSASSTGALSAVGSRSLEKAETFANEFNIPRRHGSYEALLADEGVDAIYVCTPHPMHAQWAILAAEAKKHVLVEKPFAMNFHEATAMLEAAIANDVLMMEAFMYRCHPQTAKLVELIRERVIGQVRVIQASFSFHAGFNPNSRIFNNALAGGGIMDVGCYPVSMSRLIAGAATDGEFADPVEVKALARLGASHVDEWAIASLKFPGEILAQVATGVSVTQENTVRIFGSEGSIFMPNPWQANRTAAEPGRIVVQRKETHELNVEATMTSFAYEVDAFGTALLAGKRQAISPAMSWGDTLGNIRTLDRWREEVGLTYESETSAHYRKTTVSGRSLQHPLSNANPDSRDATRRAGPHTSADARDPSNARTADAQPVGLRLSDRASMKCASLPHLEKKVSRLIMGVDNQNTFPHVAILFDDFFQRGGNAFDTAFIYGPKREKMVGEWIKLRGVRDEVAVIVKGVHTPFCEPRFLNTQLHESLERLQIDCADIYLMHRDNPQVPVGEFVDCLNEHVRAGRIRTFGGSNWSTSRIDEANRYAQKTGQRGFSIVSNNFSLARMVSPPWKGCISANDPESIAWHTRTQIPLLSWSSQARGFFLEGRAHPEKREDEELVRCWYAEDNFERLKRVNELAKKRGVLPINIALAFVLHQPFPTFALIGPRQLSETRTSLKGLEIELSDDEVKWLNLQI